MNSAWQSLLKLGARYRQQGAVMQRQQHWLFACLERDKNTDYGQQFDFAAIHSIADYRQQVPVISYETIFPFIARMANGETNVLFSGLPIAFERTGGSSAGSKLIPYSNHSLMDFQRAILPWFAESIMQYGLGNGGAYLAMSPATCQTEQTSGGISIGVSDAAYLGIDAIHAIAEISAVPAWVTTIPNIADWQLATLYWLVRRHDLEMISVWSPTFFLALLDGLQPRFSDLKALLQQGGTVFQHVLPPDATAVSRLENYVNNQNAQILWPNLKLVSCWQEASSQVFFAQLKQRLPYTNFQGKGLLATEGVVTVPNQKGELTLAADSGFFEFLDAAGDAKLADELDEGASYEVIITTFGGLYRYRTGDCVLYQGDAANGLPQLRFLGRSGLVSDLVGEKLTESFVAGCLGFIPCFHILVPDLRDKPKYVLVIDSGTDVQPEVLRPVVEEKLCKNPQYAYARRIGQLAELSICLAHNPLASYTNRLLKNGVRLGDIKVPALRPETDWLETFGLA